MFILLNKLENIPCEYDGKVIFQWLPKKINLEVPKVHSKNSNLFLELRLGYPESDVDKYFNVYMNNYKNIYNYRLKIYKGWNSYFIKLFNYLSKIITISFSKSLYMENDDRYLGAMCSYIAITDDSKRAECITKTNKFIQHVVNTIYSYSSKEEWSLSLKKIVTDDEGNFYSQRALRQNIFDENDACNKLSVEYKRELFINKYIKNNSFVVEIGCGKGNMGFLTKREITLIGIDLSRENCRIAQNSGYTKTLQCSAEYLPFPEQTVDCIFSCDVMGHIANETKEKCLQEWHRILKPGGETIHLIETDNFNPTNMAPEDYARMVLIDGHIGITTKEYSETLFSKYFYIKESFLLANAFMSAKHWLRAHDFYGDNLPGDFIKNILNADEDELKLFNLGSGIAFWRCIQDGYNSTGHGGLLFLRAVKK